MLKKLKKEKSLFPKHCIGYMRYNEQNLKSLITKLVRKTEKRSFSQ